MLDLTDKGKIKVFYDGNRQNHNKTWIPLVKPDGSVPILHAKPNPEIKIIGDVQVTICPPRYATGYKLISFEQLTKT